MFPEPTLAHVALADQRIREAARARALDLPDPVERAPHPGAWTALRATWRQLAQAHRPRERTVVAAPARRPCAA